ADAGPGVDAGPFIVGPHAPYPQMPANSGVVLANPSLVTITYASDPNAAARESFGDFVFGTQWYGAWRGDYGVGSGTHAAKVRWPGAPPGQLDQSSAGGLIAAAVLDGGLPPPDAGTVY